MWIVTTDYVKGELVYFVESKLTGERRGQFDCETWASEMARELNRQEAEPKTKVLIYDTARLAKNAVINFINNNRGNIVMSDSYKMPYVASTDYGYTFYFMTMHYFKKWRIGKDEKEYKRCNNEALYV